MYGIDRFVAGDAGDHSPVYTYKPLYTKPLYTKPLYTKPLWKPL